MRFRFRTFRYYHKPLVFFVTIITLTLLWLIMCYVIVNAWFDFSRLSHFLIPFLLGECLLTIGLAKLRYRNDGYLSIDHNGIRLEGKRAQFWDYASITQMEVYHYHESYWIENWGNLGGFLRYHNLKFTHHRSEASLDKILINDQKVYLKIRTKQEAEQFESAIAFIKSAVENLSVYHTNFEALSGEEDDLWTLKNPKSHE